MTNPWTSTPQQWPGPDDYRPVPCWQPTRPAPSVGVVLARIGAMVGAGPLVLIVGAIVGQVFGGLGFLLGGGAAAAGLGIGLGATHDPRYRTVAAILYTVGAIVLAILTVVAIFVIAFSQYHGEVL